MTIHEGAANNLLDRIMEHPGATATLADVRKRLRARPDSPERFDDWYVDAIGQVHMSTPSKWRMEQIAAFTQVHSAITSGRYGMVRIGGPSLKGGPHRDADREANAAKLSELHGPFVAEVDLLQNNADEDGTFSWKEPAYVEQSSGASFIGPCSRAGLKRILKLVTIEPWSVPLEIGSSSPSRTLLHLVDDGGVARWPYGAGWVTLFVNFDSPWVEKIRRS